MEVAMKLFKTYEETADADPSMVTDQYLNPLHLMLEMPDMSRLEKPAKPPMPSLVRIFNFYFLWDYQFVDESQNIIGRTRASEGVSCEKSAILFLNLPSTPHIMFSPGWKILWQKGVKVQPVLLGCGEYLAVTSCNVLFLLQSPVCNVLFLLIISSIT